jgi:hypothetical protein
MTDTRLTEKVLRQPRTTYRPKRLKADGAEQAEARPAHRFNLVRFKDVQLSTSAPYLVKGLVPRDGLVVIWGPPKCGKSFWTFDLFMHVAFGWDYRGRRTLKGAVVYVALEGERGWGARVTAFKKKHDDVDGDPAFFLVTSRLNLVTEYDQLIRDIRLQVGEASPVAIIVDTLNRSIQGSESSDEDMGAYIKATDAVREAFNCVVAVVHHCGVDDKRPRGHTSLTGAADAQIAVRRDASGLITATVEWMKDGADGDALCSRLEALEVGHDEEGEPITSCIVIPDESMSPAKGGTRVTQKEAGWLRDLSDLFAEPERDGLKVVKPEPDMVPVLCATRERVREWLKRRGRIGVASDGPLSATDRSRLQRTLDALKDKGKIGISGEWIWLVG